MLTISVIIPDFLNAYIRSVVRSISIAVNPLMSLINGMISDFRSLIVSRSALNTFGTLSRNGRKNSAPIFDNAAFMFANAPLKVLFASIA